MLLIFILFFGLTIGLSTITTVPFAISVLAVCTVLFKKSWVFFMAFGLGLFMDLILIRPMGYTGLVFSVFVFLILLYERKFETKTGTFVFISTFFGSIFYLWLFEQQMIIIQAFVNALMSIVLFRVILSKAKDLDSSSLHSSE